MVYVKPTVHLSRLAGTALKSFTHGYAQTVVAASQSSYAAQNTSATPLADSLLGRWRKAEKSKRHNVHHQVEGARQASTSTVAPARPETSHNDSSQLEKYLDAWQKHQKSEVKDKEWQQFQFARRIEWQPPTTVPEGEVAAEAPVAVQDVVEREVSQPAAPTLKRSYTTSALNDFGEAFRDDEAALALAKEAIADEIQRSKDDLEVSSAVDSGLEIASRRVSLSSGRSPVSDLSRAVEVEVSVDPQSRIFTDELVRLVSEKQYRDVPVAFRSMLVAGVQTPTPAAYHALLISALELTPTKHQKVCKALEVYSDMRHRKVVPDTTTFGVIISTLAARASEATALRKGLEERLARYGGLDAPGTFLYRSNHSEYILLMEDNSLDIALRLFKRALKSVEGTLPSDACAMLVKACAEQGRVEEMTRIYEHMVSRSMVVASDVFPPAIAALGTTGDLKNAVNLYDDYKAMAIEHNAGNNSMERLDNEVYAALIKAYALADREKGGMKFLSDVQAQVSDVEQATLREVVALQALLPLALQDATCRRAFELTESLSGRAFTSAMVSICTTAADGNLSEQSLQAFEALARSTQDLAQPAVAMLAMHIRNAHVEAGEPYWKILENAPATLLFVEPSTMRAVALIAIGQAERGLQQARRMFARIRDAQPESALAETADMIEESIEVIGRFILNSNVPQPEASVELLRAMTENGGLVAPIAEHLVARIGAEQIARLSPADLELLLRVQAGMIVRETSSDTAGPARFGCLLENIVAKAVMPSTETETIIERTLINIDRPELSRLWNNYRYPPTPVFTPAPFTPVVPFVQPAFEDSFDPYAAKTDVKGSNIINDLIERPHGQFRMTEALTKFRNMRRVGRVPRMFTYGKLIEGAAKEHNLNLAREILEMAKQDVPFIPQYRVVRFGWQQILDHMVAACLNVGRRDLATAYHSDMLEMGFSPSANTFGLYITTLKENTKTFDEATEAVKIFHQAKSEAVEPSSFLYNALIGKLGKARRIDDALFYFAEMRGLGIRPTSVTYGTIVNALCRVSDSSFAEEMFEEMEAAANYKPRPAPYHSLMQYFLTTKRDRAKVLAYYARMLSKNIPPTPHTYKLLIDTHATLEPIDMPAASGVLTSMTAAATPPEAIHYASLIHAHGCVSHDLPAALALFNSIPSHIPPHPSLYQSLFESLNANHALSAPVADPLLADMRARRVELTPYIANALIHGWTSAGDFPRARDAFEALTRAKREPSTYEAMVRACLAAGERDLASRVVLEAKGRGYPAAVVGKIVELVR